jgi:hypothetical protein
MDCTVEQIKDHARFRLNDISRDGGEVFTDDRLHRAYIQAFNILAASMVDNQVSQVERTAYMVLPSYTSELRPEDCGVPGVAEVQSLESRDAIATADITGAAGSPIVLAVDTGGLSANVPVIVSGVQGETGANGRFFLDILSGSSARLRGSRSQGEYTSGGTICLDMGGFTPVDEVDDITGVDVTDEVRQFAYNGGVLQFSGCPKSIQLRMKYLASAVPPDTGIVPVSDSLNYFATKTASIAAISAAASDSKWASVGAMLAQESEPLLHAIVAGMVRDGTDVPIQRRMYGGRRGALAMPYLRNN